MSTPILQFKLAFLGLSDEDQKPLRSIIASTTRILNASFVWTSPVLSDICIFDIHGQDHPPEPAIAIRFSSRRQSSEVDLARPVRTHMLLDALSNAMEAVTLRDTQAAQRRSSVRRYRGAIIE